MAEQEKEMRIEEAFAALDEIIRQLGEGEDDIETSFERYQQGLALIKLLNGKIDGIEKQLEILTAGAEA